MKPTSTLLAASSLVALLYPTAAQAEEGFLSFDMPPPAWLERAETFAPAATQEASESGDRPLPIPPSAANPPMRYHSPQQLPAGVYRRGVAVALNATTTAGQLLPPPPPLSEASPAAPSPLASVAAQPDPPPPDPMLDFALTPSAAVVAARARVAEPMAQNPLPGLFEGHSNSLVAWAVGSAEGTRTPNGGINRAYFGHTDPGNRVWNMGTFSFQHGAKTPEEADQKQLARLQNQGEVLRQRALKHGMNLTLEETLNGLDLANQSPLAAIGRVGYIERLAEAKAHGYEGAAAIVQARTRSYINPNTGRWNAPGLGNTEPSIRRDQQRRADAVAQAIAAYTAQNNTLQASTWRLAPPPPTEATWAMDDAAPAEPVDAFISMWRAPGDSPLSDFDTVAAVPVADLAAPDLEAATALEAAEEVNRGIADLWQISLDRAARTRLSSPSPQVATLTPRVLDGDRSASIPEPTAPSPHRSDLHPSDSRSEDLEKLGLDIGAAEPPAPAAFAPQPEASPTWADAREGHQVSPVAHLSAVDIGAVPDSTVYQPMADHPPLPAAPDSELSATPLFQESVITDDEQSGMPPADGAVPPPEPAVARPAGGETILPLFAAETAQPDRAVPEAAIAAAEANQEEPGESPGQMAEP